jgi:hypothetical protein
VLALRYCERHAHTSGSRALVLCAAPSVFYAGGFNGRHTAGCGEDECFNLDLDDPPDSCGSNNSQTLSQVFELLNKGLPDSGVEGLSIVAANISDPSWLQQFLVLGVHPSYL